jgi:hypothetical protein
VREKIRKILETLILAIKEVEHDQLTAGQFMLNPGLMQIDLGVHLKTIHTAGSLFISYH